MKRSVYKWYSRVLTFIIILLAVIVFVLCHKVITGQEISLFGCRFFYIASGSMEPEIPVNAIVVSRKVPVSDLKEGDIISFASRDPALSGMTNTHRIYSITTDEEGKVCFITKGDHNQRTDDYAVYEEDIYGKVIFHTPAIYRLTDLFSFLMTFRGFFICIFLPLLFVAGIYLFSFIKEMSDLTEAEHNALRLAGKKFDNTDGRDPERLIEEMTPDEARYTLELYLGKKFEDITPEDLEQVAARQELFKAAGAQEPETGSAEQAETGSAEQAGTGTAEQPETGSAEQPETPEDENRDENGSDR